MGQTTIRVDKSRRFMKGSVNFFLSLSCLDQNKDSLMTVFVITTVLLVLSQTEQISTIPVDCSVSHSYYNLLLLTENVTTCCLVH